MNSLACFFGRDGSINMWSRSICYRTWVSGAFPVAFMLKEKPNIRPWFCEAALLGLAVAVYHTSGAFP